MYTYYTINLDVALHLVGHGWSDLVKECYKACEEDELGSYFVLDVKEKFGGLRFYADGITLDTLEKIDEICARSYATCENCGDSGTVRNISGWFKTLCNNCYDKKE